MKVSICCLTYNHEGLIEHALKSFAEQKTDFDFEVVVGDDCSTDNTRQVVKDFIRNNSLRVVTLFNKVNIGTQRNFVNIIEHCQGEYIACCDGDDYWIDSMKLQKQVDFMNRHPACTLLVGNSMIEPYLENRQFPFIKDKKSGILNFDDFERNVFPGCTIFFRKSFLPNNYSEILDKAFFGDRSLFLLAFNAGEVHYVDEIWGVYRGGPTSLTRGKSEEYFIKGWIPNLYLLKPYFIKNNRRWLRRHIAVQYERLAGIYFKQRKLHLVFLNLLQSLAVYPLRRYRKYADAYYRAFKS